MFLCVFYYSSYQISKSLFSWLFFPETDETASSLLEPLFSRERLFNYINYYKVELFTLF